MYWNIINFMNEKIPWHASVNLIKVSNGILAIHKPCGILSHPNTSDKFKQSVLQAPYDLQKEAYKVGNEWVYLLNRLDSPTSGVLLLTTEEVIAQKVRNLFKEHQVQKTYCALVKGRFPTPQIVWKDFLSIRKEQQKLRSQCQASNSGIVAQTKVKCLLTFSLQGRSLSVLELYPLTGRTHQLRTQCAYHRFPILGDKTYGDFNLNRQLKTDRLYLHAKTIRFVLNKVVFEANCEADFDGLNASARE